MRRDEAIRDRSGRGSSVGGDPAKDALGALVRQFSQRSAFVRELVQNSLDAGSGRIELSIEQQKRRLRIAVTDDGEGMDRATIEGYLLTLFRSSKEQDLTKIGKFGIGFVSLFAVEPELVVVDTARDGVHHRIIFDSDYTYTLAEVDEPFEGTRVTLFVRTWGAKGKALALELREALEYWCRYAQAEVASEGLGAPWAWPLTDVQHPFTVKAPVTLELNEPGFRAVLGFSGRQSSRVGYYNHGLTLLEAEEDALPGLTFRVEASSLEHTLTRDNVRRDQAYEQVIQRLRVAAQGPLLEKHRAAIGEATGREYDRLLEALTWAELPEDLPLLRTATDRRVSLNELRGGVLDKLRDRKVMVGHPGPLAQAMQAEGHTVLRDAPGERSWLRHHLNDRPVERVNRTWCWARLVKPAPELARAAGALAADFTNGGALHGQLCTRQRRPGTPQPYEPHPRGELLVNITHPLYTRCEALGPEAAPFLETAMKRWMTQE